MRILQLGKFYPIRGGVEKVMWDLALGISERGIDCDMLCAMTPSQAVDEKDRDKCYHKNGATCLRLNAHGTVIAVKTWAKLAGTMISPEMIRWLRSHRDRYDIIHVHHPDPMAALALFLSGFKGRVILHWHSDIVSQKAFLWLYKPLQSWLVRRADTIVGTTPVYLQHSPYLEKVQGKCVAVPIGIEPLQYNTLDAGFLRKAFLGKHLLLSVGRLVPYKGYSYLIDAMKLLPAEYELYIVGNGPLKEDLEKQIGQAGLQDRVTLAGYLEYGGEFLDLFGACDALVLPSVMKTEAFGIVQIEAMSCGKPVITTKIPGSGVPWVNKDGVSGLNVEPRNPEALARAIMEVCSRKTQFGKGARELFDERYQIDTMIDKILQLYA